MRRLSDEPSTSEEITSRANAEPTRNTVRTRARVELPPASTMPPQASRRVLPNLVPAWSRAFEILRWRGPWRFLVLSLRELLKPLVYWHVYYIIQNDMQPALPTPAVKGKFETSVYSGEQDLAKASTALAGVGELTPAEIALRLKRHDAVAVAFAGEQAIGYLWMTFCSGLELVFDTVWIVHPNEAVLYDTFVLPRVARTRHSRLYGRGAEQLGVSARHRARFRIHFRRQQPVPGSPETRGQSANHDISSGARAWARSYLDQGDRLPFNLYFQRKQHPG